MLPDELIEPVDWPEYVCAILEDSAGHLLLESRPPDARFAAGQLTCFGGRREGGENPEQCLRRELREELNWEPQICEKQVELRVGGQLVAWFYYARLDVAIDRLQVLPNHQALLVPSSSLQELPLSHWHAVTLKAWLEGRSQVELDT